MFNRTQLLLAVALMGYILIGHWESLPMLITLVWHERAGTLYVWCLLYVVSSALLTMLFDSDKPSQFFPLKGWSLGVVWSVSVICTLSPILATQLFLFALTPEGILVSLIVNLTGGVAGIILGNVVLTGYSLLTSLSAIYWQSAKNPFFVEFSMLDKCEFTKTIPPTVRAVNWPAKATISLMVGYETIRDWGWV